MGSWRLNDKKSAIEVEKAGLSRDMALIREARDRAAFARLFGHFAPRIKGFLIKSGTSW